LQKGCAAIKGLRFTSLRSGRRVGLLLGSVLMLVVLACGGATSTAPSTPDSQTATSGVPGATSSAYGDGGSTRFGLTGSTGGSATPQLAAAPPEVPTLDRTIHSEPLEDFLFDTFGGTPRFIPLDMASDETILRLRDVIKPINNPVYGAPGDLPWLDGEDLVIGYRSESGAYAYPVNVLDSREIVNDEIDGIAVLVTYCPLCFSGVVFNRNLEGRVLTFGNTSALFHSDLVMYDHQTGSYWFQVRGEAVVGPLTNARLDLLPSTTITWGEWRNMFPETRLLTGTVGAPTAFADNRYGRGFSRGYQERINANDFAFPVDERRLDNRLPSGELVLTVEVGGSATAFPLGRIGDAAVNHEVGGQPITVFARTGDRASAAFSRILEGRTLTFGYDEETRSFLDRETGSVWDAGGRAVRGSLEGSQLEQLDTRRAFWFSIAIAFPGIDIYLR